MALHSGLLTYRSSLVADGLWLILLLIAVVFAYVLAKVRYYMKQSEQQWRDVDKSKLREWEDDDD